MTGDTRADIVEIACLGFVRPLWISQERTRQSDRIDLAGSDCLAGRYRIMHASRTDDRDIHEVFDVFAFRQIARKRHIYRRVRIVPGVISSIVGIEGIAPCGFENLSGFRALFKGTAELFVIFTRECALVPALHLGSHAVADRYRVIFSADPLDFLNDLAGETKSVLKRTAVFVCTGIHGADGELIQQIAFMHGVNFHAVDPGVFTHFRKFPEGLHTFVDFFLCHFPVHDVFIPDVMYLTGRDERIFRIHLKEM